MPAASTHYIFARETLPEVQQIADFPVDERAFYYGAQGPDLFFFHRLFPWQGASYRKYGTALHNNACPTDILKVIKRFFRENPEDLLVKSYMLGFMCHYCLDSTTHAYIYFVNYEMKARCHPRWWSFTVHNKIEFNIDTVLINEKLAIPDAVKFKIYETFSCDEKVEQAVGKGLAYITNGVFGTDLSAESVRIACSDTRRLCRLTTNSPPVKGRLLSILELPVRPFLGPAVTMFMRPNVPRTDWDYMNRSHSKWKNPFDDKAKESDESFDELYEMSVQKFLNLVKGFYKSLEDDSNMTPLTGNIDFSHGIPVNETVGLTQH